MWRSLIAVWAVVLAAMAAPLAMLSGRREDPKWRIYQKLFSRFEERDENAVGARGRRPRTGRGLFDGRMKGERT